MTAMSARIASVDTAFDVPTITAVPVSSIRIPADHRKHHPDDIKAFAEDIERHGLRQSIEVLRDGDGQRLVFGRLRLEAHILLGLPTIAAIVKDARDFTIEAGPRLASISENFFRNPLTALDRSLAIADWCGIYRAAQPPVKPGRKPTQAGPAELSLNFRLNSDEALAEASQQFAESFSDAAKRFLRISRAGVFRALRIAAIPSLQRDRIALHAVAANEGELYALGGITPPERQIAVVDLILTENLSVEEALDRIDQRPRNLQSKWEKLSDKFSRFQETEQDRFFDLNEASVNRWVAKRGRK